MIDLQSIIGSLSKEDQQDFIRFQKERNKRQENKNIKLFKYLSNINNPSRNAFDVIYKGENKSAYLAVRKRLFKSLVDYISLQQLNSDKTEDFEIEKQYLSAIHFLTHGQPKIGWKLLTIAEKKALRANSVKMLDKIYSGMIHYAHSLEDIHFEDIVEKYSENKTLLLQEEKLNLAYGRIRKELKTTKYKGRIVEFEKIFNNTFDDLDIPIESIQTPQALYQLLVLIRSSALITKDYFSVESFIVQSYQTLSDKIGFTRKDRTYQINILYILAHTMFRNKRFKKCLGYLDEMRKVMLEARLNPTNNLFIKHESLKALALNYSGSNTTALRVLDNLLERNLNTVARLNVLLSKVVFLFQGKNFKMALKTIAGINHSDHWLSRQLGIEYVIKRNLIEILIHIELENIELALSRIESFERLYKQYFKRTAQDRVNHFVRFIRQYLHYPERITSKAVAEDVERSFDWVARRKEDIYALSFYAWLAGRMQNKDTYALTLELVAYE